MGCGLSGLGKGHCQAYFSVFVGDCYSLLESSRHHLLVIKMHTSSNSPDYVLTECEFAARKSCCEHAQIRLTENCIAKTIIHFTEGSMCSYW